MRHAWERYRAVETEQQKVEILIVSDPSQQRFSRGDAEAFLRQTPASIVHKRATVRLLYANDARDRVQFLFSLPPEDAGMGLLVWRQPDRGQDDQWLYLPGLTNVRRVSSTNRQSFAGTGLIYEDVRELTGERTESFDYTRLGTEEVDGHPCEVIGAEPAAGANSAYRSRKTWFDRDRLVGRKVEFYDRDGSLWKTAYRSELKEVAPGVHRPDFIEVRDWQVKDATLILVTDRSVGQPISSRVFTRDYLLHPDDR